MRGGHREAKVPGRTVPAHLGAIATEVALISRHAADCYTRHPRGSSGNNGLFGKDLAAVRTPMFD